MRHGLASIGAASGSVVAGLRIDLVGEGAQDLAFVALRLVLHAAHVAESHDVGLVVTVAAGAGDLVVGVEKRSGVAALGRVSVPDGSIGAQLEHAASYAGRLLG